MIYHTLGSKEIWKVNTIGQNQRLAPWLYVQIKLIIGCDFFPENASLTSTLSRNDNPKVSKAA